MTPMSGGSSSRRTSARRPCSALSGGDHDRRPAGEALLLDRDLGDELADPALGLHDRDLLFALEEWVVGADRLVLVDRLAVAVDDAAVLVLEHREIEGLAERQLGELVVRLSQHLVEPADPRPESVARHLERRMLRAVALADDESDTGPVVAVKRDHAAHDRLRPTADLTGPGSTDPAGDPLLLARHRGRALALDHLLLDRLEHLVNGDGDRTQRAELTDERVVDLHLRELLGLGDRAAHAADVSQRVRDLPPGRDRLVVRPVAGARPVVILERLPGLFERAVERRLCGGKF